MKKNKKKIYLLGVFLLLSCLLVNSANAQTGIGVGVGGDPGIGVGTGGGTPTGGGSPTTPSSPTGAGGNATGQYQNQEKIPGSQPTSDFVTYIKQIISFGFAIIGILALFMLIIGAYQYLMAAGNVGKVEDAKETIGSALLGLILGLCAWIILLKINPDLVSFRGISQIGGSGTTTGAGTPTQPTGGSPGSGRCEPVTSGPCSVDSLQNSCFNGIADLNKISAICNAESGGVEGRMSTVDKCQDGTPFSCGALQVNMTCTCKGGFAGPQPAKGCANKNCTGGSASYQQCVQNNCYGQGNINAACQLYKEHSGNKYNTWSKNQECGFS